MFAVSANTLLIQALKKRAMYGSDLYADGAGSGGGNIGLRPHRRGAFGDLRRGFVAGSRRRTHYRLQLAAGDHR